MLSNPLEVNPRGQHALRRASPQLSHLGIPLISHSRHVLLRIKAAGKVCLVKNTLLKHMTGYDAASTGIHTEGKQRNPLNRGTPIMSSSGSNPPGGSYLEYIASVAGSWASYMRLPLLASSVSIRTIFSEQKHRAK